MLFYLLSIVQFRIFADPAIVQFAIGQFDHLDLCTSDKTVAFRQHCFWRILFHIFRSDKLEFSSINHTCCDTACSLSVAFVLGGLPRFFFTSGSSFLVFGGRPRFLLSTGASGFAFGGRPRLLLGGDCSSLFVFSIVSPFFVASFSGSILLITGNDALILFSADG